MAIKPYLIEVIGIDFLYVVEFSRYGSALIPGLTTNGRAFPPLLRAEGETYSPQKNRSNHPNHFWAEITLLRFLVSREVLAQLLGLVLKSDFVARGEG